MAEPADGFAEAREPLRAALVACARGDVPPNVALTRLLIEARYPAEAEALLVRAAAEAGASLGAEGRLQAMLDLWRAHPQAWTTVRAVIDGVAHDATAASVDEGLRRWADTFDRASQVSAESSGALYALGSPDLLRAATDEVVERMRAWGLVGADRDLLDLGCGNGRFETALASEVASITGIDLSAAMIATARQRCAGLPNVRLEQTSGRDLSLFPGRSFDVVFAVDSFPYLVQTGWPLVAHHVREAARVLRPCGRLLFLNFSYRDDLAADLADVERLAAEAGFELLEAGTRPFRLWDGAAFLLGRP